MKSWCQVNLWTCATCGKSFSGEPELEQHIATRHPDLANPGNIPPSPCSSFWSMTSCLSCRGLLSVSCRLLWHPPLFGSGETSSESSPSPSSRALCGENIVLSCASRSNTFANAYNIHHIFLKLYCLLFALLHELFWVVVATLWTEWTLWIFKTRRAAAGAVVAHGYVMK